MDSHSVEEEVESSGNSLIQYTYFDVDEADAPSKEDIETSSPVIGGEVTKQMQSIEQDKVNPRANHMWTVTNALKINTVLEKQSLQDVVDILIPPIMCEVDGKLMCRKASTAPATRSEIIQLENKLDNELSKVSTKSTGICIAREELYAECFDELIRQVAAENAARATLLIRIRDELFHSFESYKHLFDASIRFGNRKWRLVENRLPLLENKLRLLQTEQEELEKSLYFLNDKLKRIRSNDENRFAILRRRHAEEVQYFVEQQNEYSALLAANDSASKNTL